MLKTKTVKMIEVGDWDYLVESTYGRTYNYQQQDGCKERGIEHITVPVEYPSDYENDSIPEKVSGGQMGVSFAAWLARDPTEWNGDEMYRRFRTVFWERNFHPSIDMVINDLHAKGLLEAGEYTINIDW